MSTQWNPVGQSVPAAPPEGGLGGENPIEDPFVLADTPPEGGLGGETPQVEETTSETASNTFAGAWLLTKSLPRRVRRHLPEMDDVTSKVGRFMKRSARILGAGGIVVGALMAALVAIFMALLVPILIVTVAFYAGGPIVGWMAVVAVSAILLSNLYTASRYTAFSGAF